jgi:tetratricopeptide (TPR) repeat protein
MIYYLRSLVVLLLLAVVTFVGVRAAASESTLTKVIELFDHQKYDEARQALEELPKEDRRTGQALYYLGRLDLINGEHEQATEWFEKAVDADPMQSEYHHWLGVAVMRRTPYRSLVGKMAGAMKALKGLRKAIELDPTNLRPRMMLFQMMVRSYDRGSVNREDLVQQAESIARIDSVMGYVARGTFYQLVEKDLERASAELERGLDLAPENRAAAISYAGYLWEDGRKDEAIQVLTSFVEKVPDDKPARFTLGTRIILSGSNHARAKGLFEECLVLKSETGMPSEAMVRWCLGLACHLLGEVHRTEAEWSVVYKLDKDFDRVLEEVPQMVELNSILDK